MVSRGIRRSLGEITNGAHKRKNCLLTAKALCVIIYLQNLRRRAPLEAEIQPLWFRFCPALCAATLAGSDDGSRACHHHHLPLFSFIWVIVAFKNYKPAFGILGSDWVGLRYFEQFFPNAFAWRIIRNTLFLSLYSFIFSFPAPIVLALLLNEVQNQPFKKVVQTISYLPQLYLHG